MSPLIHLLVTWLIAIIFVSNIKDRRLIVFTGIILDIDGIFILFSDELFFTYHHTFGHSYIFGIPLIIMLTTFSLDKIKVGFLLFIAFSLHLVLDIVGSNWPLNIFYPFSDINISIYPIISNQIIYGVINPVFGTLLIIIVVWVMFKKEKSPMEFISTRSDNIFTGFFIYPFKFKCKTCNKRAHYLCKVCHQYFCPLHVNSYFATKCKDCDLQNKM